MLAAFVKKETLHILRDKRTILIVLLIPIILLVLFGFALSLELKNIDIAIIAEHRTESIRQLAEKIEAKPYFTYKRVINSGESDECLRRGDADAIIIFSKDFEKSLQRPTDKPVIEIITDASNPMNSNAAIGYLQSVIAGSISPIAEIHMLYNPQMSSAYTFVPGLMGMIFLLICAMITSISIVREKETGTMQVLLVSPAKPIYIVVAKMIPYCILSCLNLVTVLLLSKYLLHMPVENGWLGVCLISFLYIILSLSLGLLISSIAKNQVMALVLSAVVLLMPIMMLSGMIFPIENMPWLLQEISYIVPAKWYIEAVKKLMIEGLPFRSILTELLVLLGMTLFLVIISLKIFNRKKD